MHRISLVLPIFIVFQCFLAISAEHVTVTYHFWEKDPKIVEKAEFYTRLVANSNRFWTSDLVFLQQNEKSERIQISSENWKSANIEEVVDSSNLDLFFYGIFQKFAEKLYTNLALGTIPIFNPHVFDENHFVYQDYVISSTNSLWVDVEKGDRQKHSFVLVVKQKTFEHWEALLHYIDAIKRTGFNGYIIDCAREPELCTLKTDDDKALLLAYKDDSVYRAYDGEFEKDQIYDWILTIEQPEVKLLDENLVPVYRSGIVPGFKEPRDTVTMLFIHTKKSQIWRNYLKYAKERHGYYHLTAVISPDVKKWSIYPALITMKPRDEYVKAFTLHKDITYDRMVDYLEEGLHPSCHTLTTPSEFLFATSSKPLVVFFDPLNAYNVTKFKMTASHEQTQERIVHFAAVTGFDLFGMYLMSVFNIDTAHYVLVQRVEKGWCILTRPIGDGDQDKLTTWLENLDYSLCQVTIEDFKFPVSRLHLLERYNDVEELEKEHVAVQRNRDEL